MSNSPEVHQAGSHSKLKIIAVLSLVSSAAMIIPIPLVSALGYGSAGGLIGIAGLAVVMATMGLGARAGYLLSVWMGAAAAVLIFISGNWVIVAIVAAMLAFVYGYTAHKGWQTYLVSAPIALGFIVAESTKLITTRVEASLVFGIGFLVWGIVVAFATHIIARRITHLALKPYSRKRSVAYATLLAIVTAVTVAASVALDLGHSGAWLIMTPFLVIQPYLKDGFQKSLNRAGGTVIGFGIAYLVALTIPWVVVLYLLGLVFFEAAMYAKIQRWSYLIYAACLTPGIVIIEGAATSVAQTDQFRLEATLGGVGISLAAMAIALPIYQRENNSRSHS